jgi:hypothetical protein
MNKKAFVTQETVEKIASAVQVILDGKCSKVVIDDNIKVYECKNIIRIDLKVTEDK